LLSFSQKDNSDIFIVATEAGIIHQMIKANPDKKYIPVPPRDSTCACSECNFMKLITVKKIYECLDKESPEIFLDDDIIKRAQKPIRRMLEISEKAGL
jgi:quinolinate synthase